MFRRAAILMVLLCGPASAASLDDLAPASCLAVGQQLATGSEYIAAFNETSKTAITALKAGDREAGCTSLRSALNFTREAVQALQQCPDALPNSGPLIVGFEDLGRQIEHIGDREGCLGKPPSGS